MILIGFAASESKFDFNTLFRVYSLGSNSAPHDKDMGRVGSEPSSDHYSSNPLCPFLGLGFYPPRDVSQIYDMLVVRFLSLTVELICFTVVEDPPYPGFTGCLVMHTNKDLVILLIQLIIWDACKCK